MLVRRRDGEISHHSMGPVRFVPLVRNGDVDRRKVKQAARSIGELVE
jgi:hypothetical protein